MEAKHTPGPWRAVMDHDGRHRNIPVMAPWSCDGTEAYHPLIVTVRFGGSDCPREISEANARLIAESPMLLTSLQELVALIYRQKDFNDDGDGNAVERAESVITSALGK